MTVGENIKKYRNKKEMTQQRLATIIHKSVNTIKKYESGFTNPPLPVIKQIAKALEVSESAILGYDIPVVSAIERLKRSPGMYLYGPGELSSEYKNNDFLEKFKISTTFTEDEIIDMLITNYSSDVFNNKYKYDELTKEDYEELKPVIHYIVEMFLKNKSK